ncbi:MAG: AGE family epimerase/isomerase [Pirellulales bacterium]|nr:AGE family epimerase/isomerase [Pirellulales bacterium]
MRTRTWTIVFALISWAAAAAATPPEMRHDDAWMRERLAQMFACDQAYLWHDVLAGRAIHQNSSGYPPSVPLEGNFHTQIQGRCALTRMHLYELGGRRDDTLVDAGSDNAAALLDWVATNGYDAGMHSFYFRYNQPRDEWNKTFYPEFNMMSVAGMLRYDALRSTSHYTAVANDVFNTIIGVAWDSQYGGFMSNFTYNKNTSQFENNNSGEKNIYAAGYLASMMLDAHNATGRADMLQWAKNAVDPCNAHLWDDTHGAWFLKTNRQWDPSPYGTKYTHVIADMVQVNYQLYMLGEGEEYLNFAEDGLAFLINHSRASDGLWYRHNSRDGTDPSALPDAGGDYGPGTAKVYDRQMQVILALCLGWEATGNELYLEYIDDTLDRMEDTHLIDYPVGVNYGCTGHSSQNTWCHLWGLKAFTGVAKVPEPSTFVLLFTALAAGTALVCRRFKTKLPYFLKFAKVQ